MRNQAKPPHRGKLLFENLFGSARTPKATLEIISRGILATLNNAARLLNDARILFDACALGQKERAVRWLRTRARENENAGHLVLRLLLETKDREIWMREY